MRGDARAAHVVDDAHQQQQAEVAPVPGRVEQAGRDEQQDVELRAQRASAAPAAAARRRKTKKRGLEKIKRAQPRELAVSSSRGRVMAGGVHVAGVPRANSRTRTATRSAPRTRGARAQAHAAPRPSARQRAGDARLDPAPSGSKTPASSSVRRPSDAATTGRTSSPRDSPARGRCAAWPHVAEKSGGSRAAARELEGAQAGSSRDGEGASGSSARRAATARAAPPATLERAVGRAAKCVFDSVPRVVREVVGAHLHDGPAHVEARAIGVRRARRSRQPRVPTRPRSAPASRARAQRACRSSRCVKMSASSIISASVNESPSTRIDGRCGSGGVRAADARARSSGSRRRPSIAYRCGCREREPRRARGRNRRTPVDLPDDRLEQKQGTQHTAGDEQRTEPEQRPHPSELEARCHIRTGSGPCRSPDSGIRVH